MTVDYPFSLAQLAQILSALENERRNPNTKRNAIKAIERNAAQIGLSIEDVFDAADSLLSSRLSAGEFRAQLRDDRRQPTGFVNKPAPDDATAERSEASIMPNAGPLAVAESDTGTGEDAATEVADSSQGVSVTTTAAVAAKPETTGTRRVGPGRNGTHSVKEHLLAACRAAEHWLQAELDRPGETRPDEILRVLRAAIMRAEGQRKPREPRQLRQFSQRPRESTKEALLIDMLHRPEGATIAQIMAATGWQAHTCRGAFAGALKKKRGLTVNSEKRERGERIYHIAD
jgi:uncharacterized protein DUF3489